MVGRHDGQRREVGDGSNLGNAHPGSSEQGRRNVEQTQKDDVPVKAAALLALFHQDQPKDGFEIFRIESIIKN